MYAYSDADWAGDLDSRKSTTGYVVYAKVADDDRGLNDGSLYMAVFGAIQELIWTKGGCWAKLVSNMLVQ